MIIIETTRLNEAEMINGTEEPNLSHKTPVRNEPIKTEKLESIVSKPIADPRCSFGIKSVIQAFETPSVDAV